MKELDKPMYYNAKHDTIEASRLLRESMTYHEQLLWDKLKAKQICNLRFRRQHPIDFFIADFYCHAVKLVVEIDGEVHDQKKEYDDGRSAEMENYGIKVIRFKNAEVENDIEKVIGKIEKIVNERLISSNTGT